MVANVTLLHQQDLKDVQTTTHGNCLTDLTFPYEPVLRRKQAAKYVTNTSL